MKLPIAMVVAAVAGAGFAADGGAKELVYGSWVSPQHGVNTAGLEPMFENIEKKTEGEIEWTLLSGGQVVSARSSLPGVRDKLVDAALVIPVFTRKELKHNNILFDMQVFGDDPVAVMGASTEAVMLHCPECLADYKRHNNVFLAGYGVTPFGLLCKDDVSSLADIRNKKIRAVGAAARLMESLGAVPVGMSPTDAMTAMQRGGIDCTHGPTAWLKSYGYMDVAKTVVEFPMGIPRALCMFCMNRDSWGELTDEQKRIMWAELPAAGVRATVIGYMQEDEEVKKAALERGIKFVKGGADFQAAMEQHKEKELETIPSVGGKLGVKNSDKIMQTYLDLYPKWEKISAEAGTDVDAVAAAVKREIYDKIDPTNW